MKLRITLCNAHGESELFARIQAGFCVLLSLLSTTSVDAIQTLNDDGKSSACLSARCTVRTNLRYCSRQPLAVHACVTIPVRCLFSSHSHIPSTYMFNCLH